MLIDGRKIDGRVRRGVLRQLDKMSLARKSGVVGYEIINGVLVSIRRNPNNRLNYDGMKDIIEELSSETSDSQIVYRASRE